MTPYADRSFREFRLAFDSLLSRIEEKRRSLKPQKRSYDAQLSRLYVMADRYIERFRKGH